MLSLQAEEESLGEVVDVVHADHVVWVGPIEVTWTREQFIHYRRDCELLNMIPLQKLFINLSESIHQTADSEFFVDRRSLSETGVDNEDNSVDSD